MHRDKFFRGSEFIKIQRSPSADPPQISSSAGLIQGGLIDGFYCE
jgi:hypothetical protein